jgi:hypothetical protein
VSCPAWRPAGRRTDRPSIASQESWRRTRTYPACGCKASQNICAALRRSSCLTRRATPLRSALQPARLVRHRPVSPTSSGHGFVTKPGVFKPHRGRHRRTSARRRHRPARRAVVMACAPGHDTPSRRASTRHTLATRNGSRHPGHLGVLPNGSLAAVTFHPSPIATGVRHE